MIAPAEIKTFNAKELSAGRQGASGPDFGGPSLVISHNRFEHRPINDRH